MQTMYIFIVGTILFLLGGFMVTDVHTWQVFENWLPLSLLVVGVILISSKIYSVWTGTLFIAISGLIWFHGYGLSHFTDLTRFIDWSLVIVGGTAIMLGMARVFVNIVFRTS